MNPKVTIIIPVYKGKVYMREAIDSALAQTYKNIEILVINDGSPDDGATDAIAKSYGDKIRYIYKENGGVSTVLNLALKEMKGEYFSWLSHDDVYYPQKVEEEVKYLVENNLIGTKTILFSDYDLIDQDGILITKSIKPHQETVKKPEYALLRGHINGITLLIPKIAFDECGDFDESLLCAQDYELWYRMMKADYKFIHIPKILAKSRVHDKQVTNTNPRVETEGNKFWIDITEDTPYERKVKLEGSEYYYYQEMEKFLRETTYKKAADHCLNKMKELEQTAEKKLTKTKVTVILPFYNVFDNLFKAIKSVTEQTHTNYELLLINNGSKDNLDKINELLKNNKKIKLINIKEKQDITSVINMGLDNATGEYISFIEPYAVYNPDKIEVQLNQMLKTSSKIGHTSYYEEEKNKRKLIDSGNQNGDVISELIYSCKINISTVMLEKKYIDDNNIRFNSQHEALECLWLNILVGQKLLGINQPLTISENSYKKSKDQIMNIKSILRFVLNNEELQEYDYAIAALTNNYIKEVKKLAKENDDSELMMMLGTPNRNRLKNSKIVRISKRAIRSLKEDGFKSTFKKIQRKVKNKIKK